MLLSHLFIRINKTSGKTFNSVCTCTNVYIFVHFHLVSICNSPVAKQLNLIQIFLDTTLDHAKLFTHVYTCIFDGCHGQLIEIQSLRITYVDEKKIVESM